MVDEFVKTYMDKKHVLESIYKQEHPRSYADIVKNVIEIIGDEYGKPSSDRIHEIDDGDYQGTLVYVIGAEGYQPWNYWYVKVGYGSCSGCDTLESIRSYDDDPPNKSQVADYMALSLHIVQSIKAMSSNY